MKKIILIIVTLFLLISCDHIYYNKLYVINNCDQPVYMSITNTWNVVDTFSVNANTTFMFDEGSGIASPKGIIDGFRIEITKNDVKSKINYSDFSKWIYIEGEDKYHSELCLPINPEDFE